MRALSEGAMEDDGPARSRHADRPRVTQSRSELRAPQPDWVADIPMADPCAAPTRNQIRLAGDMTGIEFDTDSPEVVVLGGAGPEFDHAALSRMVELMLDGVPVIAMRGGLTGPARRASASTPGPLTQPDPRRRARRS